MRSAARMTGADINTVMWFLRDLGDACEDYHDRTMRELKCNRIECDEIWSYVHAKEEHLPPELRGTKGIGDTYTWIAIDPDTKLVPCWHVGQRTAADANLFMNDLASRLEGRIQLSTDGFKAYQPAIEDAFGHEIDYGQLHKVFHDALAHMTAADWLNKRRYTQPDLDATKRLKILGDPDTEKISTSIIERFNVTVRMSLRRSARATNAFSKKFENFKAAMALFHMHYNFARVHSTIRCTPAMEAGMSDHIWTLEEIAELVPAPAANRPKTYRKQTKAA